MVLDTNDAHRFSRRANCKFRPQFVASSELAQIRRMCLEYHSKTEFKGKHSQKLPEELIHAVVSLLLVLTDLCDVIIQIFLAEYLLCNNYLLKSKISRQSVKQYGTDSPLKNVIFSTYNWILRPLDTENQRFKEVCRKQTVLWIDFKFWILVGNCYIINILQKYPEGLHHKGQ